MAETDEIMLFVSHHSSTFETAEQVETALAKRGVKCWIAPRDVEPGEPFDRSVQRAIENSSAILLLFCEESDKSRHVKRELILGDSAGRPIIPLRLEAVPPGELAYHLADSQWIDWIDRHEAVMDRVAAQARQFAGVPLSGGGRPSRALDEPAHQQGTPPNPHTPPSREDRNSNTLLIGIAMLALVIAAAAVTWIVATGDGSQAENPVQESAASAEETATNTQETGEVDNDLQISEADPIQQPASSPPPTPQPVASSEPARQSVRPSFNCANASTTREFLICGSSELAAQDRELAGLYSRALSELRGTGQVPRLRADQRAWLNNVQRCTDESCISALQRERLDFFRRQLAAR